MGRRRVGLHTYTAFFVEMSAEDPTFAERLTARDGIRSVTVDGVTVTADSVSDEIALDTYNRRRAAQEAGADGDAFGIRMRKMNPPGGGG